MPTINIKTNLVSLTVLIGLLFAEPLLASWNPFRLKVFSKKTMEVIVHRPFINMRTGPGRGYPIFHVAEKGDVILIKKRRTDWYKAVTDSGEVGWVSRDALSGASTLDGGILDFDAPGWEEYLNRKFELGLMVGDFSGAQSYTALVGWRFTPTMSTELKFTDSFGDFSNSQLYSINIVSHPFVDWKISPFFTFGTGILDIAPDTALVQSEDREENVLTVGGGLSCYFSRRFVLRMEYNNHTVLTNRIENEEVNEWKAGFSVFF